MNILLLELIHVSCFKMENCVENDYNNVTLEDGMSAKQMINAGHGLTYK